MNKRGKSPQERTLTPGSVNTPTGPPAIEHAPDLAAWRGISTEVQKIGPGYEFNLITVRDQFHVETRWVVPVEQPLNSDDLDAYRIAHVRASQGITGRN